MNELRLKRMESLFMRKVSILIHQGKIKDYRVDSSVAITRVKMSKDLASAQLWISSFGGKEATRRAVKGLGNAAGFIQACIAREVKLRHTTKLFFREDHSIRDSIETRRSIERAVSELHNNQP